MKPIWVYIRDNNTEAWLHITSDGEVEITICKVGQYRHVSHTAGGYLPPAQKAVSLPLLRKLGGIIVDIAKTRPLWYEPTDSRRERVYTLAFKKLGVKVTNYSCTTTIGG